MYKNPKNAFSESYIYDDRKNIPNIYHHQEDSRVLRCWKKTTTSLVISILEKKLNILELREIGCILCTY